MTVPQITTMQTGGEPEVRIPATTVIAGAGLDTPIAVPLGITGASAGTVVAGVPHLKITVTPTLPLPTGTPIIFVGLGQPHHGVPGVYDLINNQVSRCAELARSIST